MDCFLHSCHFSFLLRSRLAIKYIKHLQYLLSFAPDAKIPPHLVEFDASLPAWAKNPTVPGARLSQEELESLEASAGAVYTLPTAALGEGQQGGMGGGALAMLATQHLRP